MKIAILGAGGVRTPLIVAALARRHARLGLLDLALMDTDGDRLALIRGLTGAGQGEAGPPFRMLWTTDVRAALADADFVITTFRVGGAEARVIDERVPLRYGVLGQETTGPGGFAMAMRTIPVLLETIALMREVCPRAWLVNFANPAGLLAEAALHAGGWQRSVGICDAPAAIARVVAHEIGAPLEEVYLDYFGLNHLGWLRGVWYAERDYFPLLMARIREAQQVPGLPFSAELISALGLIPNEYLFFYYHSDRAVQNILDSGSTRGEQVAELNRQFYGELGRLAASGDAEGMKQLYHAYLSQRGNGYMEAETKGGSGRWDGAILQILGGEGYARVALDLIEGLCGAGPRQMILNVANRGALRGMNDGDVVEVPTFVSKDFLQPLAVGSAPQEPLSLMQQVKAYEQLTIAAATEGSYAKALDALTIHPLVRDPDLARAILHDYQQAHAATFPLLR